MNGLGLLRKSKRASSTPDPLCLSTKQVSSMYPHATTAYSLPRGSTQASSTLPIGKQNGSCSTERGMARSPVICSAIDSSASFVSLVLTPPCLTIPVVATMLRNSAIFHFPSIELDRIDHIRMHPASPLPPPPPPERRLGVGSGVSVAIGFGVSRIVVVYVGRHSGVLVREVPRTRTSAPAPRAPLHHSAPFSRVNGDVAHSPRRLRGGQGWPPVPPRKPQPPSPSGVQGAQPPPGVQGESPCF